MHIQVSLIVDIDATADLSTIEHEVQKAGHQSMRQALQHAVRQWENERRTCPECGSQQVRLEGTVSRTIQALFGSVRLARQHIRYQHCFHRFCPANHLLEPMHRGRVSPALLEAASIAGASWPYRHAAQVLARLSGAQISAEEIRLLTNRCGQECARKQEQEQILDDCDGVSAPQEDVGHETHAPVERLIIGLDGGWVPSREQRGGMEGKVETQKHFSEATCILDWPHLLRTIAKAVRAVGLQREADQKWVHEHMKQVGNWLWKGHIAQAEAVLQGWQHEQKGRAPIPSLKAAITYLNQQRDWLGNYEQWKQRRYPVGSDIIQNHRFLDNHCILCYHPLLREISGKRFPCFLFSDSVCSVKGITNVCYRSFRSPFDETIFEEVYQLWCSISTGMHAPIVPAPASFLSAGLPLFANTISTLFANDLLPLLILISRRSSCDLVLC